MTVMPSQSTLIYCMISLSNHCYAFAAIVFESTNSRKLPEGTRRRYAMPQPSAAVQERLSARQPPLTAAPASSSSSSCRLGLEFVATRHSSRASAPPSPPHQRTNPSLPSTEHPSPHRLRSGGQPPQESSLRPAKSHLADRSPPFQPVLPSERTSTAGLAALWGAPLSTTGAHMFGGGRVHVQVGLRRGTTPRCTPLIYAATKLPPRPQAALQAGRGAAACAASPRARAR